MNFAEIDVPGPRATGGDAIRRGQLLAAVAHDLRGPVAAIIGQAQLLARRVEREAGVPQAQVARVLAAIEHNAQRMDAMVQELLDAAHLRAGRRLQLDRRPTHLARLLYEVVDDWRRVYPGRAIRVTAEPGLVGRWDARRLRRAFDNLLDNAAKYSPAGQEVAIEAARHPFDGRPGVRVAVRDLGVGIPPDDLPRIFDWFCRGANAADWAPGVGVGLAVARATVAAHGGTIDVESCPGQGSTFTVRLPLDGDRAETGARELSADRRVPV